MKKLSLGVVSLFICMTATTLSGSQDRGRNERIKDRFVGAWRLTWLEEQGADGKIHRADCTGLLVYARDGHMSVQVMYRNPQAHSQTKTLRRCNTRRVATRPSLAAMRSTNALTTSPIMSRARWCGPYRQRPDARVRLFGQAAHREVV